MGRLINADRLKEVFSKNVVGGNAYFDLIDAQPTVDAIPKADYENRLKADMVAMLTEILTDFDNQIEPNSTRIDCESIIEQKIQALEEKTDEEK